MSNPNTPPYQIQSNSALAITSMILGILGWTVLPLLGSIIAIITGHMAKNEIRKSRGRLTGDGMATTGLILGYASIVVGLCICAIVALFPAVLAGIWAYGDQILNTVP